MNHLARTVGLIAIGAGAGALMLLILYQLSLAKWNLLKTGSRTFNTALGASIVLLGAGLGISGISYLMSPFQFEWNPTKGHNSPIIVRGGSVTFDTSGLQVAPFSPGQPNKSADVWQTIEPSPISGYVIFNPDPSVVQPLKGKWQVQLDFQNENFGSDRDDNHRTMYICSNWSTSNPTCDPTNNSEPVDKTVNYVGGIQTTGAGSPAFTHPSQGKPTYALQYDVKECSSFPSGPKNACNHVSWITIRDETGNVYGPAECLYNTCSVKLQ